MSKEQNVLTFYVLCNKLKNVIRTGWKDWNVQANRLESVAEHVYGVQMLAIAMYSEYQYDNINLKKVLFMIAIHELGETIIGDLTQFEISRSEKEKMEHAAVHKILASLINGDEIEQLFLEFDSHSTPEAIFAYQCDKLECDIQSKIYDEQGLVDLSNQPNNTTIGNPQVQKLLAQDLSWSEMWIRFGQDSYQYDENFIAVSNYALQHRIT